jgi:hypothetical protein
MSNISGDENHLCRMSLRKSYKISSKDYAHGIDQLPSAASGAGTAALMSISLIHLHE